MNFHQGTQKLKTRIINGRFRPSIWSSSPSLLPRQEQDSLRRHWPDWRKRNHAIPDLPFVFLGNVYDNLVKNQWRQQNFLYFDHSYNNIGGKWHHLDNLNLLNISVILHLGVYPGIYPKYIPMTFSQRREMYKNVHESIVCESRNWNH